MLDDAPRLDPVQLELPRDVLWRQIPPLSRSVTVGASVDPGCSGLRLGETMAIVRRDLRLHDPCVAVLLGSDRRLRQLTHHEGSVGKALARAGFSAVVSPGFSTWWTRSPFESHVNVAHSAHFAVQLAKHLPTIPTVTWRATADLERWANWLGSSGATHAAIDLGTLRSAVAWAWGVRCLKQLANSFGSTHPRLLVQGPSTQGRLHDLRLAWPGELTILSQRPWHLAVHGRLLQDDLSDVADSRPRDVLVRANATTLERTADSILG